MPKNIKPLYQVLVKKTLLAAKLVHTLDTNTYKKRDRKLKKQNNNINTFIDKAVLFSIFVFLS